MTEVCHGLLLIEEMPDNSQKVGMIADVLRSPSAGNHQRDVVGGINIGKAQIGVPGVSWLFCIGLKPRLKIMHYKAQLLLLRRGNFHFVAFFLQPLVWVHRLKRLSCVAR